MLSSLGATVHIDTGWNPPPNSAFDLTLWQHTASFGRDQYVRVGQRGFLAPYGHRATKITVSEGRFIAQPEGAQATAYLVEFEYIIITQPVRSYAGLDLPFSEVEFVTRITPTLNLPQPFTGANAFWITAGTAPLLFDLAATDLLGRPVRFRAPGIFVGDDANFDASMTLAAQHFRSDPTINTPLDLGRQKMAFAPAADAEATSFEVGCAT